tara:strand:+ start:787 stop:2220 length:1434 start_codon:yes stop_codon:yes gene_type:complete
MASAQEKALQIFYTLTTKKLSSARKNNLENELKSLDRAKYREYQKLGGAKARENKSSAINVIEDELRKLKGGFNDVENALINVIKAENKFTGFLSEANTLLGKAVDRVEGFRIQLNKLNVGESRQFIASLRAQQDQLSDYNIQYSVLIDATEDIRNNLNELTSTTFKNNQAALTRLVAINERFGISTGDSVTLLNNLNKGFNLSGAGADKFSRTLLNFARQTGQPFNKVFQDFNSSIDKFFVTLDSSKALQRFGVFQQAARTLGTSVDGLLGVVDKFDTIEGGFELGGQINMLLSNLGGSFDAQQAILMDRPARLRMLAESIASVGGRIKGMSELGQRSIIRQLSQTTGFDVATIRGFIDKGIGPELDKLISKSDQMTAMTAADQKRLADEQTTREERRQITNDKLINRQTVAAEALVQQLEQQNQELQRAGFDKVASAVNSATNSLKEAYQRLNASIQSGVKVRITTTDRRVLELD